MKISPIVEQEKLSKIVSKYCQLRESNGDYRLQNKVWVVFTEDGEIGRASALHRSISTSKIHSCRSLFLDESNAKTATKYLWNHLCDD